MSTDNRYPLTQPSQELTADVTAALTKPYSRELQELLQDHLQGCQHCGVGGTGFCSTAQEMVRDAEFLQHREDCPICRDSKRMCMKGWAIFNGE